MNKLDPISGLAWLDGLGRSALIGVVHVAALPGTPRGTLSVRDIAEQAVHEAKTLVRGGADAVILENMHDVPYLNRSVGPEITAAMTAVSCAVRAAMGSSGAKPRGRSVAAGRRVPIGIQILAGANRDAIAVAHAADCQFVRCEGFVFAHVADEGLMPEADAGPLLRYRRSLGADRIAILADVKKKHSAHAITSDVDMAETARAAAFFGADGIIITGVATGAPASEADVAAAKGAVRIPVFVGSGVTVDNAAKMAHMADGLIVGSSLKREGRWQNAVELSRVRAMAKATRRGARR